MGGQALCSTGAAERSEAWSLPKEEAWPSLALGSAHRPKGEWVKVAEDLEASPLLPLAWPPVPPRATSRVRLWWPQLWAQQVVGM